jgi:hypothetical protein
MRALLICLTIPLASFSVITLATAQDDDVVTAKQFYHRVDSAARALAADAELVMLFSGSDVVEGGKAHNWNYIFRSVGQGLILTVEYEQDDRAVTVISNPKPDFPFDLHVDIPPIPGGWIDSDAAVAEADANGGTLFRSQHHGGYHMDLMLLPPPDRGRNALYGEAMWQVTYISPGIDLIIPVSSTSGAFVDFGIPTAARWVADVRAMADTVGDDLHLTMITSYIAQPVSGWGLADGDDSPTRRVGRQRLRNIRSGETGRGCLPSVTSGLADRAYAVGVGIGCAQLADRLQRSGRLQGVRRCGFRVETRDLQVRTGCG